MCRLVAGLACVTGNGGVRSRGKTPNDNGSHNQNQGKAKGCMVNESEPSYNTPSRLAAEKWLIRQFRDTCEKGEFGPLWTHHNPRRKEGHLSMPATQECGTG